VGDLGGGDCDPGYLICILLVSSTGWAKLLGVFMRGSNDVLDVIGDCGEAFIRGVFDLACYRWRNLRVFSSPRFLKYRL